MFFLQLLKHDNSILNSIYSQASMKCTNCILFYIYNLCMCFILNMCVDEYTLKSEIW